MNRSALLAAATAVATATALGLTGASTASGAPKADPGPTCDQLTDHLLSIMQMPDHPGMAMGNKKTMVKQCDDKHLDAKTRICMNAAATMSAVAACDTKARFKVGSGS